MKKIFMLLVACVAMVFVSCSKDDDEDGGTTNKDGKKLVSKIRKEYTEAEKGDYYELNFQYDKNGVIEKVVETGRESWDNHYDEWTDTYSFSRSGNKLTVKNDYTSTDETGKIEIKTYTTDYILNDKGYITQYEWIDEGDREVYKYFYNDEGQLVKSTSKYNDNDEYTCEYGWANGNLVSDSYTNYTYTNEENKANIDFGAFFAEYDYDSSNCYLELFGYRGKTSRNCVYNHSYYDNQFYKYNFDKDGYVVKIQICEGSDSHYELQYTYIIEYK